MMKKKPKPSKPRKPAKPKRPCGHQSSFDQKIADQICERMAGGETLNRICRELPGISPTAVRWHWCRQRPAFATQYAQAKEAQLHYWAEEIPDISDDGTNDWMERHGEDNPGYAFNGEAVARSRLRVDSRKWLLSKLMPKVYGERIDVEHGADGDLSGLVREWIGMANKNTSAGKLPGEVKEPK